MRIRFIKRELIGRHGSRPMEVADEQAAEYVRKRWAVPVADPNRAPPDTVTKPDTASKPTREMEKPKTVEGGSPLVGFVHDTEEQGGAELSNSTVIEAGKELGFGIHLCTPHTFDKDRLAACDLLVISRFFLFEQERSSFILDLLFEYRKPFIKYEHDHREIMGDGARPRLASLLFGRSMLNVFISPMQAENHREHLGDLIDPFFLLPPAVDTKRFKILPGMERDPKKMVGISGRLGDGKGLRHVEQFILAKQGKFSFEIYTEKHDEAEEALGGLGGSVRVLPPVGNDRMPEVCNSAGHVMFLPRTLEACGRAIAEGVLCGCQPVMNENVGIRSFAEFHLEDRKLFDPDMFRRQLERGPYDFWRAVDLAMHGLYERSSLCGRSREGKLPLMRKQN